MPGSNARATRRRFAFVVLVAVVGYLALWPIDIDPVAWEPPTVVPMTGVLAPNDRLTKAERLAVDRVEGPEDVALHPDGRMVVGTHDGKLVYVSADGSEVTTWVETGGRPLGLAWDYHGSLIVADAIRGLLAVAPDGAITVLSTQADGVPFKFTDDVDVATDGRIYFTDASDTWGYGHHMEDAFEGRAHGRLLRYDPSTGETTTLLGELYFANGVAVAADDSFVLVNETYRFRVRRLWLTGPQQGETDIFADVPGYPDGISRSPRGTFWVAMFTPRNESADMVAPRPWLAKMVWRLPSPLMPSPQRYGMVIELSASGEFLQSLHDQHGEVVTNPTSAEEVDQTLYVGTLRQSQIARLSL